MLCSVFREDGLLKSFVDDLASGKLHREFHYGPDPVTQPAVKVVNVNAINRGGEAPAPAPTDAGVKDPGTQPPESIFKQLKPSHNRYTVLKDEL